MFDMKKIREDFPITQLKFPVLGSKLEKKLIYMDHGASTHAPNPVIDKYDQFLRTYYANVHRGNHHLSIKSTDLFDQVSSIIIDFIKGDREKNCILFTQNTTQALDMASHMVDGKSGVTLVSLMEHHSNDLPHRNRGKVVHINVMDSDGTLDYEDLEKKLKTYHTKLVAVTGCSNVTGYFPDIYKIAKLAHAHGAFILVDGAQLLAHAEIDVRPNDDPEHIDFLAAAGHKAYAPMGSGFLFGPKNIFDEAKPYLPGGGTVRYVTEDQILVSASPDRHQGGTPNIAGAIAVGAAINYLKNIGMKAVREHEAELTQYAIDRFRAIENVVLYGPDSAGKKSGVLTFNVDGVSNKLVSTILNYEHAIATRNGRFCAHPYMHKLMGYTNEDANNFMNGLISNTKVPTPGAVRATIGIYNTREEIDKLCDAVQSIAKHSWAGKYEKQEELDLCKSSFYEFSL